ncbi:hypothetical protein TSPI_05905 [Trichinella spiralis]|uniref:Uncharacterized protein n=1 Tax=Trichinella spiralis TaxID=6334 RepID=A0ABR3KJE5_TRISP
MQGCIGICSTWFSAVQRYISSNFMLNNVTCLLSSFVHDKVLRSPLVARFIAMSAIQISVTEAIEDSIYLKIADCHIPVSCGSENVDNEK